MLDFSHRPELSLHSEVAADVTRTQAGLNVPGIIVGAFARDLHLHYGAGIPVERATEDVDFAFMVDSWIEFESLRTQLVNSHVCREVEGKRHRLRHRNEIAIDLVPFGSIETASRQIVWPPAGDIVMDVFGFQEALASPEEVLLPGDVKVGIVSLPALALLKIVAWDDRHYRSPGKDAADLMLIIRNYLRVGRNSERLFSEYTEWTQAAEFDYEQSGGRMLGHDIRQLVDAKGLAKIASILRPHTEEDGFGALPGQMYPRSPGHAQILLRALYAGFALT